MKKANMFDSQNIKDSAVWKSRYQSKKVIFLMILLVTGLFMGCEKEVTTATAPVNQDQLMSMGIMATDLQFRNYYDGLTRQTTWELQQARAATSKYKHIEKAFEDGYADINVVLPNMGHHYLKSTFLDETFEIRKPEILVYEKLEDGNFRLVAVEYAVPIELSPNTAPEGFTGSGDVWSRNSDSGLWLLHAWVWKNNPDGVFNATNPLVHVD